MSDPTVEVTDNQAGSRYEVRVGGELAGLVDYSRRDGRVVLIHTEVDEAFEGQGLAARLAKFALDDARARRLSVVPRCPYMASYIAHHPEFEDLVEAEPRA